jgi:hypothetical protein
MVGLGVLGHSWAHLARVSDKHPVRPVLPNSHFDGYRYLLAVMSQSELGTQYRRLMRNLFRFVDAVQPK